MRTDLTRRTLLKGAAGTALVAGLGAPAVLRAQTSDVIRVGHLTPLTGFLGPLGEYAVMSIKLAVDQLNEQGGIMGRKVELISEDSVNPSTASSKAQRLIERDGVALIIGEISSASGLAIAEVAGRTKTLFVNTGCNSDALRGADCNRYMFHVEGANSMYVKASGQALLRDGMIEGKKLFSLTADYAFGHDLYRVADRFVTQNGGEFIANDLVPTDATDFSAYILKVRQAQPDLVISNLAGNQITSFIKQYREYQLPFPIAGFGFDTALAWGAGAGAMQGTWPCIWYHTISTPSSQAFTKSFNERYGKPPENQAWGEFVAMNAIARAMEETKSTNSDELIQHMEKGAKFDVLKEREGYFRDWDHQLINEMYTMTPKEKGQMSDQWDLMELSAAVPGPDQELDVIAPSKEENACTFA
ncbi:ABC transporter substrate-binding protein [Geminicoccaceae bacterium 1502E]|nr:ABC transporter substrate-binding protein [Geminicoccaceae bacterium 1502E]